LTNASLDVRVMEPVLRLVQHSHRRVSGRVQRTSVPESVPGHPFGGFTLALQLPCSMLEATQEQEQLDTAMSRHGGKPCRS
jgi:hypothetical protein